MKSAAAPQKSSCTRRGGRLRIALAGVNRDDVPKRCRYDTSARHTHARPCMYERRTLPHTVSATPHMLPLVKDSTGPVRPLLRMSERHTKRVATAVSSVVCACDSSACAIARPQSVSTRVRMSCAGVWGPRGWANFRLVGARRHCSFLETEPGMSESYIRL